MNTKIEKVLLYVFSAMFLIPEVLWSPILNYLYSFMVPTQNGGVQLLRNNFLFSYENEGFLKLIILTQLIGSVAFLFFLIKNYKNFDSKLFFIISLLIGIIVCFLSMFVSYFVFMFNTSFF